MRKIAYLEKIAKHELLMVFAKNKKIMSKNDENFIAFCNELRAYIEQHHLAIK